MKKIAILLMLSLFVPSFASAAEECGVLDFGEAGYWIYEDGVFTDEDGANVATVVPAKRKLQFRSTIGLAAIDKLGGKSGGVKLSITPPKKKVGKKPKAKPIILSLKGQQYLAFFEDNGEGETNFAVIDTDAGALSRASILDSSSKIVLEEDPEAFFSFEDCAGSGDEEGEDGDDGFDDEE